ncbi:hypothetical protein CC78DRAFT_574490 [Lojkania enalia]|uniref:Uncharacterized protein n=1 Tax=Lojkania enalia TaxID=147567 RepID=A0A9P4NAH2_9PLEO|nr:hypothetical protein CC78DRAFT_574490 [Didymosphaeria enalia]
MSCRSALSQCARARKDVKGRGRIWYAHRRGAWVKVFERVGHWASTLAILGLSSAAQSWIHRHRHAKALNIMDGSFRLLQAPHKHKHSLTPHPHDIAVSAIEHRLLD